MASSCPSCGAAPLRRHCLETNATCPWYTCPNVACRADIDRVTNRHSHPYVTECQECGPIKRHPEVEK